MFTSERGTSVYDGVNYNGSHHFQQQSMPFVIYIQKKNVNGTESSCWRSGSVKDWDDSGHGFKTWYVLLTVAFFYLVSFSIVNFGLGLG